MVNDLVRINRAREVVDLLPLPISIEEGIKKETMVKRVHYSTKMADTFEIVGNRVKEIYNNSKEEINIIDTLDKRERWVANYLINNGKVKAKDISNHFKINLDTANNWIKKWIEKGFLKRFDNKQIRNVDYILTEKYLEKLK